MNADSADRMTPGTLTDGADVVIVGAGPTGLVSALLLAARGHRVAVIEKWPEPYALPRAVGISHESLRVLQAAGVIDDVLPQLQFTADGSRRREIRTADGEVLLVRHDRAESPSGWPERASFCQPELERALTARAAADPSIRMYRHWTATRIGGSDTEVVVDAEALDPMTSLPQARSADEPGRLQLTGRFVLGCDGANSTVRQPGWGELVDLGFAYDWLVVDVIPHRDRTFTPHLGQILGPPRPTTMVSGGPGRRRWEFMRLDGETMDELNRPETAWRLLEPFDVRPDNATLERHAVYTFRGRWARCWHDGRSVLAGDAAHQMPPFLGEGFNSGIRDAMAVSWRLDMVLRGRAGPGVLDAYSDERIGHVSQVVEQAIEIGRDICVTDPDAANLRDERMRTATEGAARPAVNQWRLGPGTWMADDPHAGYLGVQGRVGAGGRVGRFDDLVGRGRFVLLGRRDDPTRGVPSKVRDRWAGIGGVVAHFGPDSGITDVDGRYSAWFESLGAEVVVLRPDFYVFGTGNALDRSAELMSDVLCRLGVPV